MTSAAVWPVSPETKTWAPRNGESAEDLRGQKVEKEARGSTDTCKTKETREGEYTGRTSRVEGSATHGEPRRKVFGNEGNKGNKKRAAR